MATTTKNLFIIDPQDIFTPFHYVVPPSWPTADQKRAFEDIIAPAGLLRHHESEYQIIRQRGLLPRLGSTSGDRDVDFATQAASCRYAIQNMSSLVALAVKGVYFGENSKDATDLDRKNAQDYRHRLAANLEKAEILAANYILDWERTLAYLAAINLSDPVKTLAYITKCAVKMKAQYDTIVAKEGTLVIDKGVLIPDGVGRLKWDNILYKSNKEIVNWMVKVLVNEPQAAHDRDKSYPKPPASLVNKVSVLAMNFGDKFDGGFTKPKNLNDALTAFDLAAPPKPMPVVPPPPKKRPPAQARKKPPVIVEMAPNPQPKADDAFDHAVEALNKYYQAKCEEADVAYNIVPVIAGPIYFINGKFSYDTTFEAKSGPSMTISLDQLTIEQAECFQKHLGAFDVAFAKFIKEFGRLKVKESLAKGITAFLQAKNQ